MARSRIDMRIDKATKMAAEKAAALEGMKSLTEYVVRLIERDTQRVIEQHQAITLQNDIFDRFMVACEAADAPNKKLHEAYEFARKQGVSG